MVGSGSRGLRFGGHRTLVVMALAGALAEEALSLATRLMETLS
jgi:hypothetical protein